MKHFDPKNIGTMLTVKEAAAFIHSTISSSAIRNAIRNKELKAKKIGRRYYINTIELMRFLECPDNVSQPDSTNAKMTKRGSSSMEESITGLDMAMAAVNKLNKH